MAKLEELDVEDVVIKEKPVKLSIEVRSFIHDLEILIEEPYVQYGRDTLEGILETIKKTGRVTEGQMRAIDNIDHGGQRSEILREMRFTSGDDWH